MENTGFSFSTHANCEFHHRSFSECRKMLGARRSRLNQSAHWRGVSPKRSSQDFEHPIPVSVEQLAISGKAEMQGDFLSKFKFICRPVKNQRVDHRVSEQSAIPTSFRDSRAKQDQHPSHLFRAPS